jgi:DMSO/TMAO reductase YedYZ molybdopterin-dependent catalytic subunit
MDPAVPRLPPGQYETKIWPVLSIDSIPYFDKEHWDVRVEGEVENPTTMTWQQITSKELREEDVSDFHCVTKWSRFDNHWAGVSMRKVAEIVKPKPTAKFVNFYSAGLMRPEPYMTSMTIENALAPHVMMVYEWEGKPLAPEHGGPLRMITPHLYAWKGAKWLRRITFEKQEELGFWEERGYSQTADPWKVDKRGREIDRMSY